MKPWRKRHAGRAFTSDAPLPFKKQRTGFVGGASAEMAARTRHIMKYANPQLSAVLDAVAPAATVPAATAAKATHVAPVLQSFDSSAAVIVHDDDDKKNSAATAPAADAKTHQAAPVLQSFDSSAAVIVHDDDKKDKKSSAKPDLMSQIQAGKQLKKAPKPDTKAAKPDLVSQIKAGTTLKKAPKLDAKTQKPDAKAAKPDLMSQIQAGKQLKKAPKPDAKAQKPDAKAAGGGLTGALSSAMAKINASLNGGDGSSSSSSVVVDQKTQEAKDKVAAYQANKTPKQEEKLRAWSHKLGEAITKLTKDIQDEEDAWGDSDDAKEMRSKKAKLEARKEIIDKGLAA